MSSSRAIAKTVLAGCALLGAANAAAAFRGSFALPEIGADANENVLSDRMLVLVLHRFFLSDREATQYVELIQCINLFMEIVAASEQSGTGVGFQFRAARLSDDAIQIATKLRTGVDADVEDLSSILSDHLYNIMVA